MQSISSKNASNKFQKETANAIDLKMIKLTFYVHIFKKMKQLFSLNLINFLNVTPHQKKKKTHKSNIKVSVLKIYSFLKTYCISLLLNFINKK